MAHADNLRRHFPAARMTTYLDTAHQGLMTDAAVQGMKTTLTKLLEEGPNAKDLKELSDLRREVKHELGLLFNGKWADFALFPELNSAVHSVLYGLNLQPGDEILLYGNLSRTVLMSAFAQRLTRQIVLRPILGRTSDIAADTIKSSIHANTKLVICSQVCPATGEAQPLDVIVEAAHQHKVPVLVDGTLAAGAVKVDLEILAADFYTCTVDRWLSGPQGAAVLYIAQPWRYRLQNALAGMAAGKNPDEMDPGGFYAPVADAGRFEGDLQNAVEWQGVWESLHFLRVTAGWDYVFTRIEGLTGALLEGLLDAQGVRILTPREARAGMVNFSLSEEKAQHLLRAATEKQICISRSFPLVPEAVPQLLENLSVVSVSIGVFNHQDDVERFLRLLKDTLDKGA